MDHKPKKELGQHWLHDQAILKAIIELAEVKPTDTVLEIGPGLGTLTEQLANTAQEVIAVEYDKQLAKQLRQKLQGRTLLKRGTQSQNETWSGVPTGSDPVERGDSEGRDTVPVEVVESDIRRFDLSQLPQDYKVVANIPYYLTGDILRLLTETHNSPSSVTLLVQKEVAERWAAQPGGMSLSAIAAQLFGAVSLGPIVPAALFIPPPKVDSQVIHIVRHADPLFTDVKRELFWRVVKAGFSARRKQLRSSLAGGLHLPKPEIERLLHSAKIEPTTRAQELTLENWHFLTEVYTRGYG
jgi:16S rRNA (adenine1518-N6/adenine1519-N6)-dimethyltransferase